MSTLALVMLCQGLWACELIADFDRGKLDMPAPDAGNLMPPEPIDDEDASIPEDDAGAQFDSDAG